MIFDYKSWLGLIAVALTVYAYIPYLRGIYAGTTKPHLFTWIVWSVVTLIAVIIQIVEGAGAGAWPTVIAALICFWITYLSITRGSKDIKKIDWFFLISSLCAIPLWIITNNPAWSALLVTGIEIVASFSTIRKSWTAPEHEVMLTYGLNTFRYVLSIIALASFSVATLAFPLGMVFMNALIFGVLLLRGKRKATDAITTG